MISSFTCKWDLTWAKVRSFTSISSRTDFGVAPILNIKPRGVINMSL